MFFVNSIMPILYGQTVIQGEVLDTENNIVPDAYIRFTNKKDTINAISNKSGAFKANTKFNLGDTVNIYVLKNGFSPREFPLIIEQDPQKSDIVIENDNIVQLEEVHIVNNLEKHIAGKTIYTINPKDYLKTTNAEGVLQHLPNVTVIEGIGIKLDGTKDIQIFIDGMESNQAELKNIKVNDIAKVETVSNPSASYGSEMKDAIINIITKEKKEHFLKGELAASKSIRLNKWDVSPSISYKSDKWISKVYYWSLSGNQESKREVWRSEDDNDFYQFNNGFAKGRQDYLSVNNRFLLSDKSTFYLNGMMSGQKTDIESKGFYESNTIENYTIKGNEKYRLWNISSVYSYKLKESTTLLFKLKYLKHKVSNYTDYNSGLMENSNISDVFSKTGEVTAEVVYEESSGKLFNQDFTYKLGYKSIFRNFTYQTEIYNVSQDIQNIYIDMNYKLTRNFSIFTSLAQDFTQNHSSTFKQSYHYFLPTVSLLYSLSDKSKLTFNYSKRITRPASDKINPTVNFLNPSNIIQGNENLLPQLRHFYELSYSTKIKKINLSVKLYKENVTKAITQTIKQVNDTILYSYENAGKANRYGINLGINTKLFNTLNVNVNGGVAKNMYEANTNASLVKKNEGYSFNGGFSFSTYIKEKYSLSLSGFYNAPQYTLANKKTLPLFMSFSAERIFFNDKLSVRFSYFDVFGLYSDYKDEINYDNFYQRINVTNKLTNLSVTLTYSFGKKFNDNYGTPTINNNDIQLKQ